MSDWLKRLQELDESGAWDGAKEEASADFQKVPDGSYIATITQMELEESKSSGRLQVGIEYTIMESPKDDSQVGRTVYDYPGLERPESLPFLQRLLAKLGYDITGLKASQLPTVFEDVVNSEIVVKLRVATNKKNPDFQNKYVDGVIEDYRDIGVSSPPAQTSTIVKTTPAAAAHTTAVKNEEVIPASPAPAAEAVVEGDHQGGGELHIGSLVAFDNEGEQAQGRITRVSQDGITVNVKIADGTVYRIQVDECVLLPDEIDSK